MWRSPSRSRRRGRCGRRRRRSPCEDGGRRVVAVTVAVAVVGGCCRWRSPCGWRCRGGRRVGWPWRSQVAVSVAVAVGADTILGALVWAVLPRLVVAVTRQGVGAGLGRREGRSRFRRRCRCCPLATIGRTCCGALNRNAPSRSDAQPPWLQARSSPTFNRRRWPEPGARRRAAARGSAHLSPLNRVRGGTRAVQVPDRTVGRTEAAQ